MLSHTSFVFHGFQFVSRWLIYLSFFPIFVLLFSVFYSSVDSVVGGSYMQLDIEYSILVFASCYRAVPVTPQRNTNLTALQEKKSIKKAKQTKKQQQQSKTNIGTSNASIAASGIEKSSNRIVESTAYIHVHTRIYTAILRFLLCFY